MNAVVGTLLLAGSVLLFGWAYIQYRRPNPASWTTWDLPVQFITIASMTLLGFSLGLFGRFATTFEQQTFGLLEAGIVAAIALVTYLLLSLQVRHWKRLCALEAGSAGSGAAIVDLPVGNGTGPGSPPRDRPKPGRTQRRKAA